MKQLCKFNDFLDAVIRVISRSMDNVFNEMPMILSLFLSFDLLLRWPGMTRRGLLQIDIAKFMISGIYRDSESDKTFQVGALDNGVYDGLT